MSQQDGQALEEAATKLRNQGRGDEAADMYMQAKQAYLTAGNLAKAAGCQHMIGVSYKIENDSDRAIPALQQAIIDYRTAKDMLGKGRVQRDIGVMYEYLGAHQEAEQAFLDSQASLTALPDDRKTHQSVQGKTSRNAELGITLAKLGQLYTRTGQFSQAESYLMDGLALIRGVGHVFYEVTALMHLGSLYYATKHYGRMLANLEAALGLLYEYRLQDEHTRRLAQIWGLMAHGYAACGNTVTARYFAKKSLAIVNQLSQNAQKPLRHDIQADQLERLAAD